MRALRFVIAALVAAGVLAGLVHATPPGRNGLIAFGRYRYQDDPLWSEIYVVDASGKGLRKVSHSSVAVQDNGAQWSPDGKWIVFTRCRGERCSVWMVRRNGSGQYRLTPSCSASSCADYSHASFAPDGQHVVMQRSVASTEETSLVLVDVAGRGESTLMEEGKGNAFTEVSSPQIAPDGKSLLFKAVNAKDDQALFVTPIGGGTPVRITPWKMQVGSGDWSPDGTHVLFQSRTPSGDILVPGLAMYQVRADGTGLQKLSAVPRSSYVISGSYSPDGKSIVYGAGRDVTLTSGRTIHRDLVVQRIGTTRVVPVTHSPELDGWPAWGPE